MVARRVQPSRERRGVGRRGAEGDGKVRGGFSWMRCPWRWHGEEVAEMTRSRDCGAVVHDGSTSEHDSARGEVGSGDTKEEEARVWEWRREAFIEALVSVYGAHAKAGLCIEAVAVHTDKWARRKSENPIPVRDVWHQDACGGTEPSEGVGVHGWAKWQGSVS